MFYHRLLKTTLLSVLALMFIISVGFLDHAVAESGCCLISKDEALKIWDVSLKLSPKDFLREHWSIETISSYDSFIVENEFLWNVFARNQITTLKADTLCFSPNINKWRNLIRQTTKQ